MSPLVKSWVGVAALALVALAQSACVAPTSRHFRRGVPQHFGYSKAPAGIDSPSATCRNSLSACAALYGKEVASATGVLQVALDVAEQKSIEEELTRCANLARAEVLLRYEGQFGKPSPNAQDCLRETKDAAGRRVTWAIRLGLEMHEAARKCLEGQLGQLRPGKFSLEQRYRIDPETKQKKLVSSEEERALEASGNGGELKGTLKPDVVIHQGDPLNAQAIYDLKFPCVRLDSMTPWGEYPVGHPFADYSQGEMYEKLAPVVGRVAPWIGVTYD